MDIIRINIEELTNDPNNARKHDVKNIRAIKGSLKKFGQQKPIVVNADNVVVAGNGTLEAARQLGWETIAAVITELDDVNQSAFALADNKTAELASWDEIILGSTLQSLQEGGFNVADIGFDLPGVSIDDMMPKVDNESTTDDDVKPKSMFEVVITCDDEAHQESVYNQVTGLGLQCRILSM